MPRPPHILIIDDSVDARELAGMAVLSVNADAVITDASSPVAYAEASIQGGFDLLIVEPAVRWADRMDLVRNARRRWPRTPVVVFTRESDAHRAVDHIHAGATDVACHGSSAGVLRLRRVVERLVGVDASTRRDRDTLPVIEPPRHEWERRLTPSRASEALARAEATVSPGKAETADPPTAAPVLQEERISRMLTGTREPIRSVIGHLETLRREHGGRLDDDAFEMVRSTSESARRMLDRIDGLIGPNDSGAPRTSEPAPDDFDVHRDFDDAPADPVLQADDLDGFADLHPPVADAPVPGSLTAMLTPAPPGVFATTPPPRPVPASAPPVLSEEAMQTAYARAANIDVIRDVIARTDAITIQPGDLTSLPAHAFAAPRPAPEPPPITSDVGAESDVHPAIRNAAPDTGSFPISEHPSDDAADDVEHITLNTADVPPADVPDHGRLPQATGSVPRAEDTPADAVPSVRSSRNGTWALLTPQAGVPASTDAMQVLNDVLVSMADDIKRYGASVTYDALPAVAMSATDLAQVLRNLISNGIKYRRDERPRVHVACRREGDHDVFSVSDNGTGIAAEDRERIFEMFERAHTGNRYPGTGIGLTITRTVVEAGGGRINVQSHPGRGSTFQFTVPHAPRNVPRARTGERRATVAGLPGTP